MQSISLNMEDKDFLILERWYCTWCKYKRLAINGDHLDIDREDVHQIMAYMYRLKAPKGGVICPYVGDANKVISQRMHKDSYLGTLSLHAVSIPRDCNSYEDFVTRITYNENALLNEI